MRWLRALASAVRVMIGVPRYDAYRAHVALHHPGSSPLSREEFERERLRARYERPSRCC